MADEPLVSIIIPVWNLWDMTSACLHALAEHTAGEDVEVIVVDNHSTDATATELENLGASLFGPSFRAVRMPENAGFARGCNAGAAAAAGDLLFFLNNDTAATPGWLPPLREVMADRQVGAAGPLLLYPDNTIQHCGIVVAPFRRVEHLYERLPATFEPARRTHELKAVTGAAMMLRKEVFTACGGFCEDYRNGFEDMDLCLALYAKGLKLRIEARSVIYHHTSQTPGRFRHDIANGKLFFQRWRGALRPDQHLLAAGDGYRLRLGPTLESWLSAPDARQQELNSAVTRPAFNARMCGKLLEKEPLWRDGWFLLAGRLEQQGRAGEALDLLMSCWWLFPEERTYAAVLRLQSALGRPPDAELLRRLREERAADLTGNAALVRQARGMAVEGGDLLLAELFDGWLARYAPGDESGQ